MVLGVCGESAAAQQEVAREAGISYPLLVVTGPLPAPYGQVRSIPTTFVIDRQGIIREQILGYRPAEVLEGMLAPLLREGR